MQYLRILGRGRVGASLVVGLIACFCFVSTAEAGKRHHNRHGHSRAVARGNGGGGDIVASERYAAYVVDDKTGRVLYAKNADAPRHPASLTKMMTLYILFEELSKKRISLDTPLKVSVHAASQAPSKLGMRPGDTIEVESAIRALVTKSANDVAVTIAENIGGSEAAFAKRMTQTARRIGMNGTTFYNASGLPNAAQWTTAHDMVTLGRALAERYPNYFRYFSTRSFAWNHNVIGNHNKLLYRMEGIDGIKTGYTEASGFNLVSSLRRDGRHVVAAVMGGSSGRERDDHMIKLLGAHLGSASSGGKVSSVFREHGRTADASDDMDAIQTIAALEQAAPGNSIAAAMPAPAPTPAPVTTPKASSEPLSIAPTEQPVAAAAPAPAPAPAKSTNQPRIAASDVVPLGRREEAPRAADQHGAAVAMARAILLPQQNGRSAEAAPSSAPVAVKTVAVAPRLEEKSDKPPSLATATVTQAEVDEITTGSVQRRAVEDKSNATKPVPAASTSRTGWLVQIGAFDQEKKARDALADAKTKAGRSLASADGFTESVGGASSGLWRARFSGFADQDAADGACKALKRKHISCLAMRQ